MIQSFRIYHKDHSIQFDLPRALIYNLVIMLTSELSIRYMANEPNFNRTLTTTLVPIVVPLGEQAPMFSIKTEHNFFLPGFTIFMIPEPQGGGWSSLSEIEAESERLLAEDHPVVRELRRISSTSVEPVFVDLDEKPATETEA
jgi:hypothetical protein